MNTSFIPGSYESKDLRPFPPRRTKERPPTRLSRSRAMSPEKGTNLAHRQGNPLLGLLPRENAHFGIWREHRRLHGDGVRMRRNVIRQDQHGRLALAHEIASHGEDEVGVGAIHPGQKFVDYLHLYVGPPLDHFRTPALHI